MRAERWMRTARHKGKKKRSMDQAKERQMDQAVERMQQWDQARRKKKVDQALEMECQTD
jgi:hypothetical protein